MEENKVLIKQQSNAVKILDHIINGAIFLVFFLCPLFFTGLVAQDAGFEKMMLFYFLVLLGAIAWVVKAEITGQLKIKKTPLDWPIAGFLTVFIISTILSVSRKDSLIGAYGNPGKSLAAVIVFVIFYYLLINNINLKKIKILFWGLAGSASIMVIFSLLQLLGKFIIPLDFTKDISFNPLGSLSALSMYIVIILPLLVVGLAQVNEIHPSFKNKIFQIAIKIFLSAIVLLSLFILALLNGFTFWPAAIVGMVIVLMFLLAKIIRISSSSLIIPITTFLLLIILLVLGNFKVIALNLPAEVSLSRGVSWNIAKNSLIKNPVFGSGPSTFVYDFVKYKGADFNASPLWNVRFNNSSGYLFELAAATGVLGVLALAVILLIALSLCFLTLIKGSNNDSRSILLALFSGFVTIIIFGLLFSLNSSLILFSVLILILATAIAVIEYPEKFSDLKLSFRPSPEYALASTAIFLILSAAAVVLLALGVKMYSADYYAKESLKISDLNQKIVKINKAIMLAPYQDAYYINLANNYMALANQEAKTGKNQTVIENNSLLAIENGSKALGIAPNNVSNNEAVALIYENASFYITGALTWAENLYNKNIALEPGSPTANIRLALINMARADAATSTPEQENYINRAIKQYNLAIEKKNDLGGVYYGEAIAYERLNKIDDAISQLKQALILERENVDYKFELGRLYFNRGVAKEPTKDGVILKNDDTKTAEQIFLDITQANPSHANALYGLALLYQKTNETGNAKLAIKQLLTVVKDQPSVDQIKKQFPGLY